MTSSVLQLLLIHTPFRKKLSEELSINSEEIDDSLTEYDETVKEQDSWFSLIVICKNGASHKISARRLPQKSHWEFKRYS